MTDRDTEKRKPQIGILSLIVVLCIVVVAWLLVVNRSTPVPTPPPAPTIHAADSEEFYRSEIEPIFRAHERRNQEAAERVLEQIEAHFEHYSGGIEPFAEDLTRWGTRLRVLANMPRDWWSSSEEDRRNARLVQEKFEKHILSEALLNDDLQQIFENFRNDLSANRNKAMASVRAAVEESDFSEAVLPDFDEYEQEVHAQLLEFAEGRAKGSVYHGLATFVAAEVGTIVAVAIVARLLTQAAVSAGTAGGATAGGAAAGGGAGALGGPAGVAIGIGVGIVIGAAIDWVMTARFERKLAEDIQNYLDGVRDGLIDGVVDGEHGIRDDLRDFVADLNTAETIVLHRAIVGGTP